MSKHSKGPWEACFSRIDGVPVDFHIAPFDYGTCHPVCEAKIVVGGPFNLKTDEQVANARLIAAAPCLLEALQRTLNWLSSYPGGGALGCYDEARAAIAKATGEQS